MTGVESYQSIPDDPRDNILGEDDFFEIFLSAWCRKHNVINISDEDYEIISQWWRRFVYQMDEDIYYGSDYSIEDMKYELYEE